MRNVVYGPLHTTRRCVGLGDGQRERTIARLAFGIWESAATRVRAWPGARPEDTKGDRDRSTVTTTAATAAREKVHPVSPLHNTDVGAVIRGSCNSNFPPRARRFPCVYFKGRILAKP